MRVDPTVSRAKFEAEIQRLRAQEETLRKWGCWVQRIAYPEVDLVFVPRAPLKMSFSVQFPAQAGLIIRPSGPTFVQARGTILSTLAGRALGVRVLMDDYDVRAPSITFRDPWTWEPLRYGEFPIGSTVDTQGRAQSVVIEAHPATKQPFLCLPGTREYHEHPQHTGDDWMLHRSSSGLFALISNVWLICIENAQPHLLLIPEGLPIQWEPNSSSPKR